MPNRELKEYSANPLTENEIREMRRILEKDRFANQFWVTIRNAAAYLVGLVAAGGAVAQALSWIRGNH